MKALGFPSKRVPVLIAGACVTVLITLGFLLLFWNRFAGLRSGDGGLSAGLMLLSGIVPYRDFYCPVTPLFLIRSAAVLSFFGKNLIALRAFGIFERLLLAVLLYLWLARFFKAQNAALATVVTMIASTLDISDPISSYNHFTILLSVAAGLVSSYAFDENRSPRSLVAIGAAAGAFAFGSLAAKQTIGLAITVALPIIVGACLLRLEGPRKCAGYLGGYITVWFASLGLLLLWFVRHGILRIFLRQIFVTGPAAKSSHPGDFLTRTLFLMRGMRWEVGLGLIGFLLCFAAVSRAARTEAEPQEGPRGGWLQLLGVLLLGGAALVLAFKVPHHLLDGYLLLSPVGEVLDTARMVRSLIYLVLFGSALAGFVYFVNLFRKDGFTRRQAQFLLFFAVSFCVAFMLSLSFPAFEAMLVPGLALFLASLLEYYPAWRIVLYALCLGLLVVDIQSKLDAPFGFAGWVDPPVVLARQSSTLPELKGMLLPSVTVDFLEKTVHIIQQNSAPTDTIFVFPEFAFLYAASHRMPATFSGNHNFDVAPDSLCREEAARLLHNPPAVIVYGLESDPYIMGEERLWRNGHPSGQRDIIAAIRKLSQQYTLAAKLSPYGRNGKIYIYVRPASWPHSTAGRVF